MGRLFLLDGHGDGVSVEGAASRTPSVRRDEDSGRGWLAALSAGRTTLCSCGHGRVERRELLHHALVLLLLVGVDGLCMLAEVVEARELLAAVAGEGAFTGVFPGEGSGLATATTTMTNTIYKRK